MKNIIRYTILGTLLLAGLLLTLSAYADSTEKWRWTATALTVVDCLQTHDIVESNDVYERNPILGRHPSKSKVNLVCAISLGLQHGIGQYVLTGKQRKGWYMGFAVVEGLAVTNNYLLGLNMRF